MRRNTSLLALAAIVCVYNLPRLLTGTVQFDSLEVHYSSQRFLSDELHAGRVPFWTPYLFTGFPFLADLQVGAWYPLNWPFFAAGIQPVSIGAELLVHDLIAAGGTYALARRIIGPWVPAVGAAMFYTLSGWFAAHSQHVGMYATAAWLPWLVLLLDLLAERLGLVRLALATLLGAAVALPGHFQVALYALTGAGVWAALEALARRSRASARRYAIALGTLAVGGGLLSAVMILPGLELVAQSVRSRLNARDVPDLGYFQPSSLLTLLDPDYYGLLSGHYTGPGDSTQHYFYAGVLLVPLALLGLRQRSIARTAAFLGLPFLWYAAGPAGGLFRVVARLPGFSSVELPMHGWFLPALGLALLGGAGLAAVERRLARRWSAALLVFVLVDVLTFNQLLNPLAYARGTFDDRYGAASRAFQVQLEVAQPPVDRLYGQALTAIGYRNHALQSRVETTYGYNPLELAAYADYADAAESNPRLRAGLAPTHQLGEAAHIEPVPDALPLAYFAHAVRSVPDVASAYDALADLDPAQFTLVIGAAPSVQADPAASVSLLSHDYDSITLRYVSRSPNLLRVAIPSFPGWHASLNDAELPTLTVDTAFLGVVVPAGEGELRLFYAPRWFLLGAAISSLTLVAVAVALVVSQQTRNGLR